jgi:hypothetical protein
MPDLRFTQFYTGNESLPSVSESLGEVRMGWEPHGTGPQHLDICATPTTSFIFNLMRTGSRGGPTWQGASLYLRINIEASWGNGGSYIAKVATVKFQVSYSGEYGDAVLSGRILQTFQTNALLSLKSKPIRIVLTTWLNVRKMKALCSSDIRR